MGSIEGDDKDRAHAVMSHIHNEYQRWEWRKFKYANTDTFSEHLVTLEPWLIGVFKAVRGDD